MWHIVLKNIHLILLLIPYGNVIDICDVRRIGRSSIFGMDFIQAKKRLHGFFCKVAALIVSPYPETMLLDLDVVFFKSPHLLFDAPAYRETGTLFFHDRITFKDRLKYPERNISCIGSFLDHYGIHINDTSTYTLLRENGVSLFWNYGLSKTSMMLHYQESSVLLLNRATHPVTLEAHWRFLHRLWRKGNILLDRSNGCEGALRFRATSSRELRYYSILCDCMYSLFPSHIHIHTHTYTHISLADDGKSV